jgi:hypothetical protein
MSCRRRGGRRYLSRACTTAPRCGGFGNGSNEQEGTMESEMSAASSGQNEVEIEYRYRVQGAGHSLLDVLLPATPPEPKNARVIRLFDIEGAAKDAQPATADAQPTRREARSGRRASRELRAQSLLAAAGHF